MSQSQVSKTIYRDLAPLDVDQLDRVCQVLGVTPSDVLRAAERALTRTSYYLAAKDQEPDINEEDYH